MIAEPYLTYIKAGVVVTIIAAIFFSGIWIRGVVAERDELKQGKALAEETTKAYAQQFQNYITTQREIADAIKKVKIQSTNIITQVEQEPPPAVPDDGIPIAFIPPGLPVSTSDTMPRYTNNSSVRTPTTAPES